MRKVVLMVALSGAALLGMAGSQAQAQTYPNVASLTPFVQPSNYMSIPGYLRLRYLQQSGRWISRDQAVQVVRDQGGYTGAAPTGG